jgi:hypothetical protein
MKRVIVLFVLGASSIGCSTVPARVNLLKERAAFDLQCPKEQIETTDLGGGKTYGVRGCGKQVTYVAGYSCKNSAALKYCKWVMNTDSQPTE